MFSGLGFTEIKINSSDLVYEPNKKHLLSVSESAFALTYKHHLLFLDSCHHLFPLPFHCHLLFLQANFATHLSPVTAASFTVFVEFLQVGHHHLAAFHRLKVCHLFGMLLPLLSYTFSCPLSLWLPSLFTIPPLSCRYLFSFSLSMANIQVTSQTVTVIPSFQDFFFLVESNSDMI